MSSDRSPTYNEIFDTVMTCHESLAHEAQGKIGMLDPKDRQRLRDLIQEELAKLRAEAAQMSESEKNQAMWERAWLANTMGLLAANDRRALDHAVAVVHDDQSPFVRFWAFAGLAQGDPPAATQLASEIYGLLQGTVPSGDKGSVWSHKLATALLAKQDPAGPYQQALLGDVQARPANRDTLRALALVPLDSMVDDLIKVVGSDEFNPDQYRAIEALGRVSGADSTKEEITEALVAFIRRRRTQSMWDGTRTYALEAIGGLGRRSAHTLLEEEILDPNPAIVRAAALSLELVLAPASPPATRRESGTGDAVRNIVKIGLSSPHGQDSQVRYAALGRALRWMNADQVAESLEEIMVSGPQDEQESARRLLTEVGGAAALQKLLGRKRAFAGYQESVKAADEQLQRTFDKAMREGRFGYYLSAFMDTTVFVLGITLLAASAFNILRSGGTLDAWAGVGATTGGVLTVLYGTLIREPRDQVDESVDHLMSLKVIFGAFLRELRQVDQAFGRWLVEDELKPGDLQGFTDRIEGIMGRAINLIRFKPPSKKEREIMAQNGTLSTSPPPPPARLPTDPPNPPANTGKSSP